MQVQARSLRARSVSSRCNVSRSLVARRVQAPRQHAQRILVVRAEFAPPTVADTKRTFMESYSRPIPAVYNTVIQELLVQLHFVKNSINYKYNPILALGITSVFDQILDGYEVSEVPKIWNAYVRAYGEDPARIKEDAAAMEEEARSLGSADKLVPDASGNKLQQALAQVAEASADNAFAYNKFFAVGLFRLLELTGAKEPAALERLVKAVGVKPEAVNKDLLIYKGILSKLSAAKEMLREFLEREKRKQAEREAAKAAAKVQEASSDSPTSVQA